MKREAAVFDIWRKIEEKGAVAIPIKATSLFALGWVEINEKYPELVPEEFRRHDVYSDPQLIRKSPFAVSVGGGKKAYHFKATSPTDGKSFEAWINPMELIRSLQCDDFQVDDADSIFGGALVCSCGIAGCAGLWSQTCHFSEKMIHWSIVKYDEKFELFFERESYEKGALEMLKSLLDNPGDFSIPVPDVAFNEHSQRRLVSDVERLLDRRPHLCEIWERKRGLN